MAEHPRLRDDRYAMYKKEIYWQKDINKGIEDDQLCAQLATNAEGLLKTAMAKLTASERQSAPYRTIDHLVAIADGQPLSQT